MGENLLEIKGLCKHFNLKKSIFEKNKKVLHAVDDVTLEIKKGETLGLVGESGCGKTTLGRTVVRLYEPTSGEIVYDNKNITNLNFQEMKSFRRKIQMIFQDPYASLNPRQTIGDIIKEPMEIHNLYEEKNRDKKVLEILELVGLNSSHMSRYPHEFSGGQRQRIGIARAIALQPKLIICDEPVSALDVSIQAKIINLLNELQEKMGIAYIFISHDLSVVKHIADRVGVMYLGNMMEMADTESLYAKPLHPYTQALFSAIPRIGKERIEDKQILGGDVPSPANPPKGCRFCTRCPKVMDICKTERPDFKEVEPGHFCACHLYDKK